MTGGGEAGPRTVAVVVPTTAGPVMLRALRPRPGLPASAAFADGDYRPLPWSADYARLCAPDGPLSRVVGDRARLVPHELRLGGSFDAGRSWEVPVCLAHGLVARGWHVVADTEEADLVLWATGAVDLDLAVLAGDYALLDKIERSRALLDAAVRPDLAVLLPDGPERAEAERAVRALGRERTPLLLPVRSVADALEAFCGRTGPEPAMAPPAPLRGAALSAAALTGLAAAIVLGALLARPPDAGTGAPPADEPVLFRSEPDVPSQPASAAEAPKAPVAAAIQVEELVAPAGSSCRRVVFGADPPARRPVPIEEGERLRASRLTPELCGFAIRAVAPGARAEVGLELRDAALPPQRLPDGAQAYFLREGARRNLVYTVQAIPDQAVPEGGRLPTGGRLAHALVR